MNHLKRPCAQHLTIDYRTPLNGTQILKFVCFEVKYFMSTEKHFKENLFVFSLFSCISKNIVENI